MHLGFDLLAEAGGEVFHHLADMRTQFTRFGIDDLEFFFDTNSEPVIHARPFPVRSAGTPRGYSTLGWWNRGRACRKDLRRMRKARPKTRRIDLTHQSARKTASRGGAEKAGLWRTGRARRHSGRQPEDRRPRAAPLLRAGGAVFYPFAH